MAGNRTEIRWKESADGGDFDGIRKTEVQAADCAETMTWMEITTETPTLTACVRTEILWKKSAEDADVSLRILAEIPTTGVLERVRTEIRLKESADDADAPMMILTETFTDGASATPTAG